MKRYTIGLITGILLTASAVIFMGANSKDKEVGRYQVSTSAWDGFVYYSILDTKDGNIIKVWKKQASYIGYYN